MSDLTDKLANGSSSNEAIKDPLTADPDDRLPKSKRPLR